MIKTSEDMQAALELLTADTEIEFSGAKRAMDSQEFNAILYQIETDLNKLYENIRLLNDVYDYSKNYIVTSVEERRQKFIEKLKVIEQLTDSYRDKSYVTQLVPFQVNQEHVTNRSGQKVPVMQINSGSLEMNSATVHAATIDTVFQKTSNGQYSCTAESLSKGEPSRSIYESEEPIDQGVQEEYEVRFKQPTSFNYIDIDTVGCDLKKVQAINTEGEVVGMETVGAFLKPMELSGIRFRIQDKDFRPMLAPDYMLSTTKTLTVTKDGHRGNAATLEKDEQQLRSLKQLANLGVYRGKYAKWSNAVDKVAQQNALNDENAVESYSSSIESRDFDADSIRLPDGSVLETLSETGYRYTPSNEVAVENVAYDGKYVTESKPSLNSVASESRYYVYQYELGIDRITVEQREMQKESGYVSDPVIVKDCSYIELSSVEVGNNPVEYYILDGIREIPLLPVEKTQVEHEELLYQMNTRFAVSDSFPVTIYEDDIETNLLLSDKDSFDYAEHDYTVSYTPAAPYQYVPQNQTIRVKILQKKATLPTTIKAVSIRKHGGGVDWTILD